MKGELEQLLLFIYRDMDKVSKKDIHEAIKDRLILNTGINLSRTELLKKIRNTFNEFGSLYNEAIMEISVALSQGKDAKNQRKYRAYELAAILNTSTAAVSTWIKNGEFKNVIQEGRKVLIIESDIDLFIESHPKRKNLWEMRNR